MQASEGKSAKEITAAIGGTTRGRVVAKMSEHGIRLVPKRHNETCVRVIVTRATAEALSRLAVERDGALEVLAADLLAIASEPVLFANLLDDEG